MVADRKQLERLAGDFPTGVTGYGYSDSYNNGASDALNWFIDRLVEQDDDRVREVLSEVQAEIAATAHDYTTRHEVDQPMAGMQSLVAHETLSRVSDIIARHLPASDDGGRSAA